MKPSRPGATATIHHGDCLEVLASLPEASVDAVVTDPPYAVDSRAAQSAGLQGKGSTECLHCGKGQPLDGHTVCQDCLVVAERRALMDAPMLGMRSQNWDERATHSRGYADNDPRTFQRWCETWAVECLRVLRPGGHILAFGGTRTWHRMAVAFEDVGFEMRDTLAWIYGSGYPKGLNVARSVEQHLRGLGRDESEVARETERWTGWSTTLKPGHEPILVARKPLDGTVADNVTRHGPGALNVGACGVGDVSARPDEVRHPSNVFLDQSQAERLDGVAADASRFFWVSKPNARERVTHEGVAHPTVKPLDLMRELVRLVTPAGGLVLEPFAGSGTTVEACLAEGLNVIAVERDEEYVRLVRLRVERVERPLDAARRRDQPGVVDLFTTLDDGTEPASGPSPAA